MLSINTNFSSIIAQRSMKQSTNKLNQAIERMTTGAKINHAKDNAANYNIATNMTTKLGALQVAEDNCAMGLDMIATANGTLDQIHDKLQRLRNLAVQASNGTYGEQSKQAINAEANALVDEIERLYNTTEYNGIKLFELEQKYELPADAPKAQYDGFIKEVVKRDTSTMTTLASVDSNTDLADGTYSISTPEEMKKLADMTNAGLVSSGDEFVLANDIDLGCYENWTPIGFEVRDEAGNRLAIIEFSGTFDGNGFVIANMKINDSPFAFVGLFGAIESSTIKNLGIVDTKINTNTSSAGLVGHAKDSSTINCYVTGHISSHNPNVACGGLITDLISNSLVDSCYTDCNISAMNTLGGLVGYADSGVIKNSFTVSKINQLNISNETTGGLIGNAQCAEILNSVVNCSMETLRGVFVGMTLRSASSDVLIKDSYYVSSDTNLPMLIDNGYGIVTLENIQQISPSKISRRLQVGVNNNDSSVLSIETEISILKSIGLQNIGLSSANDKYIASIDSFLTKLSDKSIEYGAIQNRLESALEEISTQYENIVSSRSTLRDADIAEVSSSYIQQQILQQASATLMATANQSPSIALQLI